MTKDEALAGELVTWGVDWGKDGDIPCVSIIKRLPDGGIEVLAVEYGPPRPWVGLTDEEILQGNKESWVTLQAWQSAVWWAEAKLREKNA